MTRHVSFRPSGRRCEIEDHETVLAASLRAGLAPSYGCSNGNCGDCRARLIAGDIAQVRHHDFGLSAEDQARGVFLMCANCARSDIEIEANVTSAPNDIARQEIETRVKGLDRIDPQIISLHLQTPRSQRLRFVSGQSVTLSIGGTIRATLPIASCPCDDRNLFFHVPDLPGNAFCEAVHSGRLSMRDPVLLEGPLQGDFHLDMRAERPSLFLCWHTGFAPVISLIEHAISLEVEQDIVLHRFSPTPDNQYLANLCRSWADAFDTIEVALNPERITLLTSPADCRTILDDVLSRHPAPDAWTVYVSGPPNFAEAARAALADHGVPAARIRMHVDAMMTLD